MKKDLGKIDYTGNGKKSNLVTLEWSLKTKGENKITFSMSAAIWNSSHSDWLAGGQMVDEAVSYFPNDKQAQRMAVIWGLYHLNDLNAGTPEQTAAIGEWEKTNKYEYTAVCEYLKSIDLYEVPYYEGLHCTGGFPVEVVNGERGYKYGEGWIFSAIPDEVIQEIRSW